MTQLILQVLPSEDSDAEELADLGTRLRDELLEYDVASVTPLPAEEVPSGAKGIGQVAGWLVAQFGTLDGLRAIIDGARAWATRNQRSVELAMGGDRIVVKGATEQQEQDLIDAFLARHGTRA